ncbi:MAG: hypothetical protein ACRD33_00040 [Candidatus Acidiferrales bacterium]
MSSEVLDGELISGAQDGIDEQQAYRFEEFRSSAASQDSSLIVTVYRHPANPDGTAVANGKLQYMFQLPLDQLSREQILDKVAREYMSETDNLWYVRLHVRQQGKRGILFNELCTVLRQPKTNIVEDSQAGSAGILAQVGKMLADAQARTDALFARLLEQQKQPQINPIELFLTAQKESAAMFEKVALAMRGAPAAGSAEPGGLEGMLKQLMVMKQISEFMGGGLGGVAAATPSSASEIAEIIKSVMPVAAPAVTMLMGEWMKKNKGAPPALTGPAPKAAAPAAPHEIPTPAPAAPAAPAPKAAEPATVTPIKREGPKPDMAKEDAMLYAMRSQLGALADVIASQTPEIPLDVATVGGEILTNLPEMFDDPLYTLLAENNWFDRLTAVQPKLLEHKEWMTKLRQYILDSFEEDTPANDP